MLIEYDSGKLIIELYKFWYKHRECINDICIKFRIDFILFDIFNEINGIEVLPDKGGGKFLKTVQLFTVVSMLSYLYLFYLNSYSFKDTFNDVSIALGGVKEVVLGLFNLKTKSITSAAEYFVDDIIDSNSVRTVLETRESLFHACNHQPLWGGIVQKTVIF